jgi:hypothetical protein
MIDMRDPHIAVGALVCPAASVGELPLIGSQFIGEVAPARRPGQERVTAAVPVGEGIRIPGGQLGRPEDEPPLGGDHALHGVDLLGRVLSRRLHRALDHSQLRLTGLTRTDPVQPLFQGIEGGVPGVELETLGLAQIRDAQEHLPFLEMQLHEILVLGGELYDVDLCVPVHPEEILFPEMDLEPTLPGSQRIAADHGQVDGSGFRTEVVGPLHVGVPTDITHPGVGVVIVCFFLGHRPGEGQSQTYG